MDISFNELKSNAKRRIFSQGLRFIFVNILFFAVLYIMEYLSMRLSGYDIYMQNYMDSWEEYLKTGSEAVLSAISYPKITVPAVLLLLSIGIMNKVVNVGYAGYCLDHSRNKAAGFKDIFNSFNYLFRIIGIMLLRTLITILYCIPAALLIALVIIPGVLSSPAAVFTLITVAVIYMIVISIRISLQYGLVFYVMFDNPDMSVLACLKVSKQLVKGHLMQYLALQLSFIAWYFLNSMIAVFFLPVIAIWLNPYQGITIANYYNKLTGRYVNAPMPVPNNDNFN